MQPLLLLLLPLAPWPSTWAAALQGLPLLLQLLKLVLLVALLQMTIGAWALISLVMVAILGQRKAHKQHQEPMILVHKCSLLPSLWVVVGVTASLPLPLAVLQRCAVVSLPLTARALDWRQRQHMVMDLRHCL